MAAFYFICETYKLLFSNVKSELIKTNKTTAFGETQTGNENIHVEIMYRACVAPVRRIVCLDFTLSGELCIYRTAIMLFLSFILFVVDFFQNTNTRNRFCMARWSQRYNAMNVIRSWNFFHSRWVIRLFG